MPVTQYWTTVPSLIGKANFKKFTAKAGIHHRGTEVREEIKKRNDDKLQSVMWSFS